MNAGIKSMAQIYYNAGYFRTYVRDILQKSKPSKEDEKKLVDFCIQCQKETMANHGQGMTIKEMKKSILNIIGRPDLVRNSGYQSTVGRTELRAILDFVTQLPADYIAERVDDELFDD